MAGGIGVVGREAVLKTMEFRPKFLDALRPVGAAIVKVFKHSDSKVPPKSTMMVLDDPLTGYDLALIGPAWQSADRSLLVWTVKTGQPQPDAAALAPYGYLLRMGPNGLTLLRTPANRKAGLKPAPTRTTRVTRCKPRSGSVGAGFETVVSG